MEMTTTSASDPWQESTFETIKGQKNSLHYKVNKNFPVSERRPGSSLIGDYIDLPIFHIDNAGVHSMRMHAFEIHTWGQDLCGIRNSFRVTFVHANVPGGYPLTEAMRMWRRSLWDLNSRSRSRFCML